MHFKRIVQSLSLASLLIVSSCTDEDPLLPDADPKDKFLGTWTVSELSNGNPSGTYPASIIKDTVNTSRIKIRNIYNLGNSVSITALVAGNNLDISSQNAGGLAIAGGGQFSGTSFVLNYTVNDGSSSDVIKATYTR